MMSDHPDVPSARPSDLPVLMPDDASLLALLRGAIEDHDPVPARLVDAAVGSFAWRTIDAELADLVEDSSLDALAGIRSDGGPRLLTFEFRDTAVVLEVSGSGTSRHMLGQLVGSEGPSSVEVRHAAGSVRVDTDDLGRFAVDRVPSGPMSLVCDLTGSLRLVTSWVQV
jgi:hypothetical protein